jgi:hypothetical protein
LFRSAALLLLAALCAPAQDLCRNGIFADDQPGLLLARAIAGPATELIVSKIVNGRACVWQSHDKVGWMPAASLDLNVPYDRNPPPSAWAGDWKFFDNHLVISAGSAGLHLDGHAFWHGIGSDHTGQAAGDAVPVANRLVLKQADCELRTTLLNRRLVATDNRKCGGGNVTFSGVYELSAAPFETQATSTLKYGRTSDGADTVDIVNVTWDWAQRLVLRKTHVEHNVIGDQGNEPTIKVEAWPLGVNPREKPLYSITLDGQDAVVVDDALLVFDRTQETPWWSVYRLDTGQPFFNTFAPLLHLPEERYAGLEIPEGEAGTLVGTLTYASQDRIIRQLRITCDTASRAAELRSFAENTFELAAAGPAIRIKISATVFTVPIANDNLDPAHARLPAGLHLR